MSYVFPSSPDKAIDSLALGTGYDNRAMLDLKAKLPSPGVSAGLEKLRKLADGIFSNGCPEYLCKPELTFVDAIQDIANEAKKNKKSEYRILIEDFLVSLNLVIPDSITAQLKDYVFPTNVDQAIDSLALGTGYDNLAMLALKAKLPPPPGATAGLEMLRVLADEIFNDGCPEYLTKPEMTFAEAIQDIANEAKNEVNPAYRMLITAFLQDLNLTMEKCNPESRILDCSNDGNISSEKNRNSDSENPADFSESNSNEKQNKSAGTVKNLNMEDNIPDVHSSLKQESLLPEQHSSLPEADIIIDPFDDYDDSILSLSTPPVSDGGLLPGDLKRLPSILPPLPAGASAAIHAAWVEGIPVPGGFNLKVRLDGEVDELVEMLSEFHAVPEAACQTYSVRNAIQSDENMARYLLRAGSDLGFQGHTLDISAEKFLSALEQYFSDHEPENAEFLSRLGFELKLTQKQAVILSMALDIESYFHATGPDAAKTGVAPDIRGALSSGSRLDMPYVLNRAVFLHFSASTPLADGLVAGLGELRHAQLCRYLEQEVTFDQFESIYEKDWFIGLNEFDIGSKHELMPS